MAVRTVVDHQVTTFWDREISQSGHNLLLARSSGDDYKSATLHCTGSADPYDVEEGVADSDCGWSGPNIRPGRWHEKHIRDAFAQHVADVTANGPIVHGGAGPGRCQCFYCRHGLTADQMKAAHDREGQCRPDNAPNPSAADR
jgi:hypothetical protein